ncbi:TolC family outer membrane protein [Profundibacterium mesophilum]|uniref:Outer membrane efflux protein n=1 Tax=Profundibacterium mesophilum KAUST100406-0324 TaxID=1037889 RepID=A0A921P070_9RHOB|nr:TolC family outer membrane protein [Profundibacterium mesophilum]KAF0676778.1 Outer membrane efflux protein [Profundibacterium mesophilum KAUST100406-0324]
MRAAALVAAAILVPAAATAASLADTLVTAYRHSGLLEQNRATLRAADEDVAQAISTLRPVIGYTGDVTYANVLNDRRDLTATLGLNADLLLYDGGASRLAIDATKETVLITREQLLQIEQQVLFDAVLAHLDMRRAMAFLDLAQNNVRLIDRQLSAARDRFEVGEITRTDVSIAESRLASARSSLASARGDLAAAEASYREAVGVAPSDIREPQSTPRIADSLDAALAIARRNHPAIRQSQRQVTVAEINVARAEAGLRPRLSARAGVSVNQDFDDASSIGVQLSGPVYSGGQIRSLIRQAAARRDAARSNLHVVRHQVDANLRTVWSQYQVAIASLAATREQINAATVAFRGVQEEATLGARTTLDVLNAEQELLDARASAIASEINRTQSVYALLSASGLLTVDHLDLGIVTYDPAAYYNAVKSAPRTRPSAQGKQLDDLLKSIGRD